MIQFWSFPELAHTRLEVGLSSERALKLRIGRSSGTEAETTVAKWKCSRRRPLSTTISFCLSELLAAAMFIRSGA